MAILQATSITCITGDFNLGSASADTTTCGNLWFNPSINRLQYSPDGSFNIGALPPPPLDRYLNFMMTFGDANIPREIYGVLVQSYEDLVNMTVGDNSFYEKAKNMYDIELKLLLNIYQLRQGLFTPDEVKEINAQIHQVNKASVNKDRNYFMQIKKLSTLLL